MSARRSAGPFLVIVGGLVMVGGIVASWVRRALVRDVGDVPIAEAVTHAGTEFAGAALPVAVAALVLGLLALLLPSARRILGAVLFVAAFPGSASIAWGVMLARDTGGSLTAAPALAWLGCVIVFVWAMAMRSRAPAGDLLDERYTVEGAAPDDAEWELAADESDGSGPPVG